MEVRFLCLQAGKKFYSVVLNGEAIFVGTRPECGRFMKIHDEKVEREQAELRRAPRSRPFDIRTYHQARLHA